MERAPRGGEELPPGHVPALPRGEAAPVEARAPSAVPVVDAASAELEARLAAGSVVVGAALPRVLYTWTTREQIEAMAVDRVLLRRSQTAAGEVSRFDRLLAGLGEGAPAAARRLGGPGCERRRFAWPNPWATLQGWPGESYGDQLVEIVLKPEAVVAIVDAATGRWSFVDREGRALDEAEAAAAGERVAVVLHQAAGEGGAPGTLGGGGGWPYREFVICDEAMVERWSYGTPAIRRRLGDDAVLLDALARAAEAAPLTAEVDAWPYSQAVEATVWRGEGGTRGLGGRYAAALAWATADTLPTPATLRAIASALRVALDAQIGEIEEVVRGRPPPPPERRRRPPPPRRRPGTL